ncbi:putative fructokinase-5 [Cinnamomum micranthum f. kanehirae]|uniref:Putative fructokinase-5 n=1 Tax=Cinnamomum micranthum f. kanehirae TaxID=337451 RepID=A0A3S3N038_9MAGN|nr:putative fructokinase-5 [Cinnamomum micranthum f. kanehirae]
MVTRPSSASSEKTSSTTCSHHLETERPQQRRSALREISSHRPRICQLGISWNGEREFMYYRKPSADMLLTPSELNLELIRKSRVDLLIYGLWRWLWKLRLCFPMIRTSGCLKELRTCSDTLVKEELECDVEDDDLHRCGDNPARKRRRRQ